MKNAGGDRWGAALPDIRTTIPGPASIALAQRLARVESRNITRLDPPPIFWEAAFGANVRDADGNTFIDLTAGFGVAAAGHAPSTVQQAISDQVARLAHGLGDVHPPAVKVELLEKLAQIAPGDLEVSILGSSGAEAVEAALKTAFLKTGREGIVAFEGAYHGLTYGALGTTHRANFRAPFEPQLFAGVRFAPFPTSPEELERAFRRIDDFIETAAPVIGAILVEPIQGRGGLRFPPPDFLRGLRERCDGRRIVLIFDEIYTGLGRTGHWFACEHAGVTPDLLVLGKALSGSIALSAVMGSADVMAAWPPSTGEAIHTSTFLGNPVACAAALAQIATIESEGLLLRAREVGSAIAARTAVWKERSPIVSDARGQGGLQAVEFVAADPPHALRLADQLLSDGVIVLAEGPQAEVLALTPPLIISEEQIKYALDALERRIFAEPTA